MYINGKYFIDSRRHLPHRRLVCHQQIREAFDAQYGNRMQEFYRGKLEWSLLGGRIASVDLFRKTSSLNDALLKLEKKSISW